MRNGNSSKFRGLKNFPQKLFRPFIPLILLILSNSFFKFMTQISKHQTGVQNDKTLFI